MDAYLNFARRVLLPDVADRHAALCTSSKGQRKLLEMLCHRFASGIRPGARRAGDHAHLEDRPCCVYFQPLGFGVEFATVRAARERLALEEGWLLVLSDASAGLYRPEGRWDEEGWLA